MNEEFRLTRLGAPKSLRECTLPFTGRRVVDRIITDVCVRDLTWLRLSLVALAPDVTLAEVAAKTAAMILQS